ncbi:hypothetical protein O181_082012 [Austropuccinia psidii MF-1]|uniref:Ergosterol biosynthetic protein 28 n=1 Tax=Austropuccinia psidii MF-1 TaxID=1389203 RepID=A0A9Q3FRS0_9BASI|nr:hypothetical protein [Austropuccinia psidii MF-1]
MGNDLKIPLLAGLPSHPGLLPKWLLLVAIISVVNSLQTYLSLAGAKKVYNRQSNLVSGLQSRTFGTWTLISGIIRCYAAYNISNSALYHITIASFLVALLHFTSEFLIYQSAGSGALPPFIVAFSSSIWMISLYDYYVPS